MNDIERESREREREALKEKIATDVNDVVENIIKKTKQRTETRKAKRKWWTSLIMLILILGSLMLVINFILVNVWLLKFFIKDLWG